MLSLRAFVVCCAASVAIPACGGGDGAEDTPITELTDEQIIGLCEDLQSQRLSDEEYAEAVCRVASIMAGEQGGDCAGVYDACLADPPTQDPPEDCSDAPSEEVPNCPETTAGDFIDCGEAQLEQIRGATDLTCDDSIDSLLELPPECVALMEECPDAFSEESGRVAPSLELLDQIRVDSEHREIAR